MFVVQSVVWQYFVGCDAMHDGGLLSADWKAAGVSIVSTFEIM